MKLFFQLIFFLVALVLTFFAIFIWFAIIQDATPQGLLQLAPIDRWSDGEWISALVGGFGCPIVAIIIYFMLWKTNFFSRNK